MKLCKNKIEERERERGRERERALLFFPTGNSTIGEAVNKVEVEIRKTAINRLGDQPIKLWRPLTMAEEERRHLNSWRS